MTGRDSGSRGERPHADEVKSALATEALAPPAGQDTAVVQPAPRLARALAWTGASALIVPLGGLVVQPILAHSLGATGRGEVGAALAPATVAITVATLGLPEALTYLVARDPRRLRRLLGLAISMSLVLGLVCVASVAGASGWLARGDDDLRALLVLAGACALPLLAVGAVRGAALGAQLYSLTTAESVLNALARVAVFSLLAATETLTPVTAVLTMYGTQLVAAVVYVGALRRRSHDSIPESWSTATSSLLSYGGRTWFGSIAGILLARTAPLLMVPLSSTYELGLYSVVRTLCDLPVLAAFSIAQAVSGVNSRSADWGRVARSSRTTLLATLAGSAVVVGTLHLWLTVAFGEDFAPSYWPVVTGMVGAVVATPAYVLSAGLSSSGRPGARTLVYVAAFIVNGAAFVALVPSYGALGASLASIVTGSALTAMTAALACRLSGRRASEFLVPRRADVADVATGITALGRRLLPGRGARSGRGRS